MANVMISRLFRPENFVRCKQKWDLLVLILQIVGNHSLWEQLELSLIDDEVIVYYGQEFKRQTFKAKTGPYIYY